MSKISFSRARSSWPSSSSANTFITLVLSTAKTVPDAPLLIDFAGGKEKDRFQESLLRGDMDALVERRAAQPAGCREVGDIVVTSTRENSERDISMSLYFSKNRDAQGQYLISNISLETPTFRQYCTMESQR